MLRRVRSPQHAIEVRHIHPCHYSCEVSVLPEDYFFSSEPLDNDWEGSRYGVGQPLSVVCHYHSLLRSNIVTVSTQAPDCHAVVPGKMENMPE